MPYGTVNADVITTSTAGGVLGAGNASIMKNRLINGNMSISQRYGTTSTILSATGYSLDRWNAFVGDGGSGIRYSFQQVSTAPTGFSNSVLITTTTSGTSNASDRYFIQQSVEGFNFADCGWGTADAKTVTISFWVRSSLTGTFGGALGNENQDRAYPFTYTISSANTWEYKSITVAGDTTGTWTGATNGTGVKLYLNIATGSTRTGTAGSWSANYYTNATGAVNLGQTASATINWTGVQLEVGSSATGFEYVNYQTSLANCQRYYWQQSGIASTVTTIGSGMVYATTDVRCSVQNPVTMRTTPTITFTGSAFEYERANLSRGTLASMNSTGRSAESSVLYSGSGTTVATSGDGAIWYLTNSGSNFGVSAEL